MKKTIERKIRSGHSRRTIFLLIGCALVIAGFSGCSTNTTFIEPDLSVDRMFSTNKTPESYSYYYIGTIHRPYAIIGLVPGYSLTNTHWWEPLRADKDTVGRMIQEIRYYFERETNFGGIVKDTAGKQVGIWFSGMPVAWAEVDSAAREVYVVMENPWSIPEQDSKPGTGDSDRDYRIK